MFKRSTIFNLTILGLAASTGCNQGGLPSDETVGTSQQEIADVNHTEVERQSIGNCWLYAQASWVESMNLSAVRAVDPEAEELDVSQSYWTYWHWFDQVTGYMWDDKISTGGNQWKSHGLVRDRGLMLEADFVPEDVDAIMSDRQEEALETINQALKEGGALSPQQKHVRTESSSARCSMRHGSSRRRFAVSSLWCSVRMASELCAREATWREQTSSIRDRFPCSTLR